MTKKRPLRGFKLFKQKYLNKQRLYTVLAKLHLVREVKATSVQPYFNHKLTDRVILSKETICAERGTFNLSYFLEVKVIRELWQYVSLFRRKPLHTVKDEIRYEMAVSARSECLSFWVKPDPFQTIMVDRNKPVICTYGSEFFHLPYSNNDELKNVKVREYRCDFYGARLAVNRIDTVSDEKDIEVAVRELIERVKDQITEYINTHSAEINEKLCGVKFDGALQTSDGHTLMQNCICHKCGHPVFTTSTEGYTAQCIVCDEDLYTIEIDKVDPVLYQEIIDHNERKLYHLLTE